MTDADRLTMLKIDLGISAEVYDQRLTRYLQAAQTEIEREGITFPPEPPVDDEELIISYAAWKWRQRATGEGMPRMLRYALNNRLLSQKARTEDG
ncbi:hypothetical protein [Eubacterium sp. MSJ-33]|jgi:hypothetical protein|uniref:hypothetical protein n=1 Tax=Eubacterium sp. MSJ-33 TaxID=2841528 RepID=UPI001C7500FE|nr:hypothetical protein [Eubacterium sp. MSJ-33]QWT53786.1 hypothetical protein KP625_03985 [Eubacterium sp. MSJ-33]DAY75259.1 MAG TPA: Head Tail Connector Protein [Caudoviricetes sp.]